MSSDNSNSVQTLPEIFPSQISELITAEFFFKKKQTNNLKDLFFNYMCMGGYKWVMYTSVMSPEARRGSLTPKLEIQAVVRGHAMRDRKRRIARVMSTLHH